MKKIVSIFMAAALLFAAAAVPASAEEVTVRKKMVNVAKNKPITSDTNRSPDSHLPHEAVDDEVESKANNFWFGYTAGQRASFVLDLQRRYPIEAIRIFDRADAPTPNRGKFEIWGADQADMSDKRLLFELNDNDAFPAKGDYLITLSEKPICRYVQYLAKESAVVYIREFQVFASFTATEISRGVKTWTAGNHGGCEGSKAVDGDYGSAYATGALSTPAGDDIYSSFTMDLGEAKSIDMIELYGRKAGTNRDMDGNFKVYGSNDGTVTDFEAVPEGSATPAGQMPTAEFEALGYTAIADFSHATYEYVCSDGSKYEPYPYYNYQTDPHPYPWQMMVNRDEVYRYLTHRKTAAKAIAQFSEFKVYQINPELQNICMDNGQLVLEFSDEMDAESVREALTITESGTGEAVMPDSVMTDAAKPWQISVTLPEMFGKTLQVRLNRDAADLRGVSLDTVYQKNLTLPKALQVLNATLTDANETALTALSGVSEIYAAPQFTNNASAPQKVLALLCVYNEAHTLIKLNVAQADIAAGASAVRVPLSVTLNAPLTAGDYVTLHLWNGLNAAEAWQSAVKMTAE